MQATILKQLRASENLCEMLATFNQSPAIFYQKAPDDTQFDEFNYPMCVFSIDKFADAIRGVSGLLTVDIITANSAPERIEPALRKTLEGYFFKPARGEIFQLKWQRTDAFQEPASERLPLIVGATVTFEVYEFPSTETISPDAIQTLNLWATTRFTNAVIIGATDFGEVFLPTGEHPAIYFDTQRTQLLSQMMSSAFLSTTITAHIFSDNVKSRREWISTLYLEIVRRSTFLLEDSSPLRLTNAEINFAQSEIQGQIVLTFELGIQRFEKYAHPLNHKVVDIKGVDANVYNSGAGCRP